MIFDPSQPFRDKLRAAAWAANQFHNDTAYAAFLETEAAEQLAAMIFNAGQVSKLKAEIERLRAVLRPMVEHFSVGGGHVPIGKMLEDARRALEDK
jgi:hypothetical protein